MDRRIFLQALASLALLAACTRRGPVAIPTLAPPPDSGQATMAALGTELAAQLQATADAQGAHATPSPATLTAEPLGPEALAEEAILILEPGEASSLSASVPVRVAGEADPTFEQTLVIVITDANGVTVAVAPAQIQADIGQRGPFAADVPIRLDAGQAGAGRITVYSSSARDGGLIHLASVEVTLLASGESQIAAGQPHREAIDLFAPARLDTVSGGRLHVSGFSHAVFENQLRLTVCGEGGVGAPDLVCGTADNVIAEGTVAVQAPDVGQPGPFETDLSYNVRQATVARLVVFSLSPRDGGIVHLSSREVRLTP